MQELIRLGFAADRPIIRISQQLEKFRYGVTTIKGISTILVLTTFPTNW